MIYSFGLQANCARYISFRYIPSFAYHLVSDPGYLKCLHSPNITVTADGVKVFTKDGIITKKGEHLPFDVAIFGTGFHVVHHTYPTNYVIHLPPCFPLSFLQPSTSAERQASL